MPFTGSEASIRTGRPAASESRLTLSSWNAFRLSPGGRYATRVALWGLVLFFEVLWLTICFDSRSLEQTTGGWSSMFQLAPRLSQWVIAMGMAFCLAGKTRLLGHWREFSRHGENNSAWKRWGLAQLTAFFLLAGVSEWIYEGQALSTQWSGIAALAWVISAAATFLCWLGTIAPLRIWARSLIQESRFVVLGGFIGLGSLVLARSAQSLWEPLSDCTLALVAGLLSCCFSDLVLDAGTRLIGTTNFRVEIAPQCSGYEGVGLILIFLAAFFILFRHRLRFPHAWLLWPLAVLAIWFCNALRIALLIAIGATLSPEIAMGGFHSQAGWIFFNVVALLITAMALKIPWFNNQTRSRDVAETSAPVVWFLAPFLCLMTLNLLTAAVTADFDWWYPLKVAGTCLAVGCLSFRQRLSVLPELRTISPLWQNLRSYLPAVGNGVVVFVLWVAMIGSTAGFAVQPEPEALQSAPLLVAAAWLFARVFGSTIVIPVVEELAFRGYLLRRFVSDRFEETEYRTCPLWTVIASSICFGLMHQHWIAGIMAGLAYAFAARRRNSLSDAILAHAVTNGLIAVTVLFGGAWWLW